VTKVSYACIYTEKQVNNVSVIIYMYRSVKLSGKTLDEEPEGLVSFTLTAYSYKEEVSRLLRKAAGN